MLAGNLKKIREELGLSMTKFSEKLEIPAMTLIHYENGERTPSAQLFIQLYKKLNVNINWFISGEGEMFNKSSIQLNKKETESEQFIYNTMLKILKRNGVIN